eukprot:GILK01002781.1.p1 GENE.GILK01002781.1~~GILK01002781.1.p1  ORF type:complete len:551 (-),score=12.58 GILK01002781.1:268-1743(-)
MAEQVASPPVLHAPSPGHQAWQQDPPRKVPPRRVDPELPLREDARDMPLDLRRPTPVRAPLKRVERVPVEDRDRITPLREEHAVHHPLGAPDPLDVPRRPRVVPELGLDPPTPEFQHINAFARRRRLRLRAQLEQENPSGELAVEPPLRDVGHRGPIKLAPLERRPLPAMDRLGPVPPFFAKPKLVHRADRPMMMAEPEAEPDPRGLVLPKPRVLERGPGLGLAIGPQDRVEPRVEAMAPRAPLVPVRKTLAEHIEEKSHTCRTINLYAPWGMLSPEHSWYNCASRLLIDGYSTYVVPQGLMMYHGSHTLPDNVIPSGLGFFSGYKTAEIYANPSKWEPPKEHMRVVRNYKIHAFKSAKPFAVVNLMSSRSNEMMDAYLKAVLKYMDTSKVIGFDKTKPLELVTGYVRPGDKLKRVSFREIDKLVFSLLCADWTRRGIAGFAGLYDYNDLHPELMLCHAEGLVRPDVAEFPRRFTVREWEDLGRKQPPYNV